MAKKLMVIFVAFVLLLLAANYQDIKAKLTSKSSFDFDHSSYGIDVVSGEELEYHFGQNDLVKEEDGEEPYYMEPKISLREKIFCRGGAGKAASCKERPINPYWESWEHHYGSPDNVDSVAKQEYEEKYKGYHKTKRGR